MLHRLIFILLATAAFAAADPLFKQNFEGKEFPVDYEKYGTFKNVGTDKYEYEIKDYDGLSQAVGDGIFPNNFTVYSDPSYKKLVDERRLIGTKWEYVNGSDIQACYFTWSVLEDEEPGVKLFYTAYNLERAGLYQQAVKAYYAIVVNFPRSIGWTYWNTPWYVGVKAIDVIQVLLRKHPEIGYTLVGADITVQNGFDIDASNDIFIINPGKLVKTETLPKKNPDRGPVTRKLGGKNGELVQYQNGDWEFLIDGKPTMLKAISYQPISVFQSHDEGTVADWMTYDSNKNGKPDSPMDAFVDKNGNNKQDADEPSVGDFKLMADMGVNCVRIYHHATNKELLRQAFKDYGLRIMQGDLLGMYCVGSGASWDKGTDYGDEQQKKNMLESVKKMVLEFKDEPYVCMWVLGNENNYGGVFGNVGGVGNVGQKPEAYYTFVNEAAKLVKSLDNTRPVAICNGDLGFFEIFSAKCPDVDVFGANAYRGSHGFGQSIWGTAKKMINRPVIITEYGCPGFHEGQPPEVGLKDQADYDEGAWEDISFNSYSGNGFGNAIGGVLFEWVDGWWKSGQPPRYSPAIQETVGQWPGPFPDGWSHEEWFGVCSQGNGTQTPFLRTLRPVYYVYQKLWKEQK